MSQSVLASLSRQQQDAHGVFVDSGVIRDSSAVVVAYARQSAGAVFIVARGMAGAEVGRVAMSPLPLTPEDEQHPMAAGLTRLEGRLDLASLPPPIIRIEVLGEDDATSVLLGVDFQLRELCFEDQAAFKSATIARRQRDRPRDTETQLFLARQIARHLPSVHKDRLTEVALTMTATQAYRASELMRPDVAATAIETVDEMLNIIDGLPDYSTNSYARISLLTAKWHAAVALDDPAVFDECLSDLASRAKELTKHKLAFTLHYNAVRSLLALAGYRLAQGRVAEADELFASIIAVMAAGGSRFTDHPAHIREFARTCTLIQPIAYLRRAMTQNSPLRLEERPIKELRRTLGAATRDILLVGAFRTSNAEAGADAILSWVKLQALCP
ncbi:hypothetical protein G3576_00665 [Roseomonas stagni]|uniref:Uncharacterized protein n=1 Tax=Falsiroseomonas algicola TaxID=2716930 RepID=A0A6M1LEU3_9PROT|nr:hypothetical protein [Falsiroseomonas algicola]NGM18504.1 hypothetical protein [Falsiroseomonas algicola]